MIPFMTQFEKKNLHPLFSPESADWQTCDRIQCAETHFFVHIVFRNIIPFGLKL
jgi:hypothetical protein